MNPRTRRIATIAVLLIALIGVWRVLDRAPVPPPRGGNAVPVRVALVSRRDMPVVERSLGSIVANTSIQLTSRVQGTLERAAFQEGQFVKKGELLFQIDPRPFVAELAQAKAVYERDQAQLANARRDSSRYNSLGDQGAISKQQRDAAATNVDMLVASVAADRAAVQIAQLNLEYTQIRSPIDGKTGPLLVQPGNLVVANGASPLVIIMQVKPVKVSFALPQRELPRIQARAAQGRLLVSLDTASDEAHAVPVTFIGNAVSAQTGTIELRASFPNEDLALVPGALVNVTVQLDELKDALVVPRDAVNDGPDGSFIYTVHGTRATKQPVQVLFDDGRDVAIAGQLQAGDRVIVEGQLRVVPDGQIRIIEKP